MSVASASLLLLLLAVPVSGEVIFPPGGSQELRVLNVRSRVVEGCLVLAGTPGRMLRVYGSYVRVAEVIWFPVACPAHQPAALREAKVSIGDLEYDRSAD